MGYIGAPRSIHDVLTAGDNSLTHQAWAPRDMRGGGTVNVDGFGVAWWATSGQGRYRSAQPIWSDPAVHEALSGVHSRSVIAAVRSATEGMPVERSACAPFVDGQWAFSHNGVVRAWPSSLEKWAAQLPVTDLLELEAPTDSAALWLLLRHRLRNSDPERAITSLVHDIDTSAPNSRLNLLLGDGKEMWATSWDHSLSVLVDENGASIASEPLDDNPNWQVVPDRHFVSARPGHLIVTPL